MFDFEMTGELKQYLQAQVFGDIFVDVRVEFRPRFQPSNPEDKLALDIVNSRLRMISGEVSHTVREVLEEKLRSEANPELERGE